MSFEGVIGEIIGSSSRTFCYITSSLNDPILNNSNPRIKTFYINKLLPLFMQIADSKVFVMTLAGLGQSYFKRSKYPVHYVYLFHALVSTHMVYNFGSFDHYDSIICVGPHHIKEIRAHEKLYNLRGKQLIKAGYYRLERIMDSFDRYKTVSQNMKDGKTILIAPSWGDKNILETCGHKIVGILLGNGYRVIVRPHSETIKRSPDIVKEIEKAFINNSSFKMEKSNASDESILSADMLISDSSGIALEYAFGTLRPVIFINVPLKIKNDKYRELAIEPLELGLRPKIGRIVEPENIGSLPNIIEDMISSREEYRKNIIDSRWKSVYNIGNSSKIGAEYILSLFK